VAPVYLKEVSRIQSLLAMYFFALLVQTLLERELRSAMSKHDLTSLPIYPEGRPCRAPTLRRVLDLFENVQRHELTTDDDTSTFITELTPEQRTVVSLLGAKPSRRAATETVTHHRSQLIHKLSRLISASAARSTSFRRRWLRPLCH